MAPDSTKDQLHFNAAWIHNAVEAADEREHRGYIIAGYSRLLTSSTLLVADLVREWDVGGGDELNLIEVGVITSISDKLKLAFGVGAGIGDESPEVVGNIGLQYDF